MPAWLLCYHPCPTKLWSDINISQVAKKGSSVLPQIRSSMATVLHSGRGTLYYPSKRSTKKCTSESEVRLFFQTQGYFCAESTGPFSSFPSPSPTASLKDNKRPRGERPVALSQTGPGGAALTIGSPQRAPQHRQQQTLLIPPPIHQIKHVKNTQAVR